MALLPRSKINIRNRKVFYGLFDVDFNAEYQKMNKIFNLWNQQTRKKPRKMKKFSVLEKQKIQVAKALGGKSSNYSQIAKDLGISTENVRHWCLKIEKSNAVYFEKRGRKKKLNSEHLVFLSNLISDSKNFGITLAEMKSELVKNFELEPKDISISTIYRAL